MLIRKPVFMYELISSSKAVASFFGIILGIFIFIGALTINSNSGGIVHMVVDFPLIIFFFIMFMSDFTQDTNFFLQHGVSRKSIFTSGVANMLVMGAICAALTMLLDTAVNWIFSLSAMNVQAGSIFWQIFANWSAARGGLSDFLFFFLWKWTLLLAMGAMGYFITSLAYRLSKTGKIIVSSGAIAFVMLLPIINRASGGWMGRALLDLIFQVFGGGGLVRSPIISALVFLGIALVFSAGAWLLVRRFQVKK